MEDRVPRTPATGVSAGFFSAGSGADGFYSIEPIRWKEENAEQGKEDAPDEPLVELLNALLRFVENHLAIVLDVTERNLASKMLVVEDLSVEKDKEGKRARYEVLTRVVWDEIATRLMGELGSVIFAAGRPGVFHRVRFFASPYLLSRERVLTRLECLELPPPHDVRNPARISLSNPFPPQHIPHLSHHPNVSQTLPNPRVLPTPIQRHYYLC